jgi:hypothetical protein
MCDTIAESHVLKCSSASIHHYKTHPESFAISVPYPQSRMAFVYTYNTCVIARMSAVSRATPACTLKQLVLLRSVVAR